MTFTWGFPIAGELSHQWFYPVDTAAQPQPGLNEISEGTETRYVSRAAYSDWVNAEFLLAEAIEQLKKGWIMGPPPSHSPTGRAVNARKRAWGP